MRTCHSPLALAAGLAASAMAQGPVTLLADVETNAPDNPGAFYEPRRGAGVLWNSFLYFAADGDGLGAELWRSNGAAQNATLVADLVPDGGSSPWLFGLLGGWLLFAADDGWRGRELWRSDGTFAGTEMVKDLAPGAAGSMDDEPPFVFYNNTCYFLANGALWKTDGTAGNTVAVGQTDIGATELVAGGSQLWLVGDTGNGPTLWSSDGGSTVVLVRQLPSWPSDLCGLPGSQCVFGCNDGIAGEELWRSDGTFAGTQMLADIDAGSRGSAPRELTLWNQIVYFRAAQGSTSRLWRTDGTLAGTSPLDPAVGPRSPQHLTATRDGVYFAASASTGANVGSEVWTTDGTVAGTRLVQTSGQGRRAAARTAAIVEMANQRCNQERTIGELKSGVNALGMPLGDLHSTWAYTVIATLAWNLSRWVGLALPESGRWAKKHAEEKNRVTKMRFRTFVQALMTMPAHVLRTARQLVVRLLDWNPYRRVFFRALEAVRAITKRMRLKPEYGRSGPRQPDSPGGHRTNQTDRSTADLRVGPGEDSAHSDRAPETVAPRLFEELGRSSVAWSR